VLYKVDDEASIVRVFRIRHRYKRGPAFVVATGDLIMAGDRYREPQQLEAALSDYPTPRHRRMARAMKMVKKRFFKPRLHRSR